jgi:hypothetical protein
VIRFGVPVFRWNAEFVSLVGFPDMDGRIPQSIVDQYANKQLVGIDGFFSAS